MGRHRRVVVEAAMEVEAMKVAAAAVMKVAAAAVDLGPEEVRGAAAATNAVKWVISGATAIFAVGGRKKSAAAAAEVAAVPAIPRVDVVPRLVRCRDRRVVVKFTFRNWTRVYWRCCC